MPEEKERAYIKNDKVEEEHEDVDDEGGDALQLAHNGLGVLQGEGQMLPLLQKKKKNNFTWVCQPTRLITCANYGNHVQVFMKHVAHG